MKCFKRNFTDIRQAILVTTVDDDYEAVIELMKRNTTAEAFSAYTAMNISEHLQRYR